MRLFLIPAAALALAACAAAPVASAETAPSARGRTLIVSGYGEAAATPDILTLTIGVETEGDTAAAALQQNSARMAATIARLKERGIEARDMQTSNLSVHPRYQYIDNRSPKVIGYAASNTLTVKLRKIADAGALIDAAVSDGANTVGGIRFGFADDMALLASARTAAVSDAREKAAALAKAAGVTLGPILQIQDGFAHSPPPTPYMDARAVAMEAKTPPVESGESTVSASVTLVYEIR